MNEIVQQLARGVRKGLISFTIPQHHSETHQQRHTEAHVLCCDETQDQRLWKNWAEGQGTVQARPR